MDADAALSLVGGFEETVAATKSLDVKVDAALIAAGRTICRQVQDVLESGTSLEQTKALYLLPHLVNILREMEATPKSRSDVKVEPAPGGASSGGTAGRRALASQRRLKLAE